MSVTEIPQATSEEARRITDRIKVAVEGTWQLIEEAYLTRSWAALGYASWNEYCTREFGTSRLRIPAEDRQEIVASLREAGLSTRSIGAATGQSHVQVQRDLAGGTYVPPAESDDKEPSAVDIGGTPEFTESIPPSSPPKPTITGADGKRYPSSRPVPPTAPIPPPVPRLQPVGDEEPAGEFYAGPWMPDEDPTIEDEPEPSAPPAFVRRNTGENEWYTPPSYTRSAREVMGAIDLDPASTAAANDHPDNGVGAAQIWTAEDDGLAQPWTGRVWLNPPYERGLVDKFCTKLAEEYEAGNVAEAVVLVNNSTDSAWFHELLKRASAVCYPLYRVRFWNPAGRESNPLQGQAVLYLGPPAGAKTFKDKFGKYGQASLWESL